MPGSSYMSHDEWETLLHGGRPTRCRQREQQQQHRWERGTDENSTPRRKPHREQPPRSVVVEGKDGGFESRVAARTAAEARAAIAEYLEPVERRLSKDVETTRRALSEVRSNAGTLEAEVSAQKREIASCAKMASSQDLALEVMRHEFETCRGRLAKLETDRGDHENFRSRVETELSTN
mmetsp:Transcript_6447/g.20900  ORF Transcript_6447/g.20900 Transcript_6447/m.20900 type:complete len:179 (-) Transcript_6447:26-562(-)